MKLCTRAAAVVLGLTVFGLPALPASATPGMVRADGCHSKPRHCHGRGELKRNKRGRLYVPGAFHGRGSSRSSD